MLYIIATVQVNNSGTELMDIEIIRRNVDKCVQIGIGEMYETESEFGKKNIKKEISGLNHQTYI